MARMKTILLNINDWMSSTMGLDSRARGCYINVLCRYYEHGGPLPFGEGDKKELCSKLNYKNIRSMEHDLNLLFKAGKIHVMESPTGPVLVNGRSDTEITKYEAMRQGHIKGGGSGKPYSKTPRPSHPEQGQNPVSPPYQRDIAAISPPYRAENAIENEQNQEVSGNSSITLNLTNTTARAHARGPVAVPDPVQVQAPGPAGACADSPEFDPADLPAPAAARVSRIPTPAPSRSGKVSPSAHDPVLARDAFNRTKPVPDEGTPEWDAYQRKLQRLAITAEVKRICVEAGVWDAASEMDSAFIAAWLKEGADPEIHIYPAVSTVAAQFAARGDQIWGIGVFSKTVRRKIELEDKLVNNPSASARSQTRGEYKSGGYGGSNGSSKPKSPVPEGVMTTIRMARQNEWDELLAQMCALLTQANKGDEQSLQLLNDLHAKHASDVLVPHSVWLTQHQSSAA